jgi:hypothetical protein
MKASMNDTSFGTRSVSEDVFTRAVRAAWARRAPGARRIAAFIA